MIAVIGTCSNSFTVRFSLSAFRFPLSAFRFSLHQQAASALMGSTKGHQRVAAMHALATCASHSLGMMQGLLEDANRPLIEGWMRGR